MKNLTFVMFQTFKERTDQAVNMTASAAHSIHLAYPLARIVLLTNLVNDETGLPDYVQSQLIVVDYKSLMFSRLRAYQDYIEHAEPNGYVVFCDTDMLVLRRFDELFSGQADLALSLRKNTRAPILGSLYVINLARKKHIQTFFSELMTIYDDMPELKLEWDSDQTALAKLLDPPAVKVRKTVHSAWRELQVDYISVEVYNNTPSKSFLRWLVFQPRAKFLHFKGPRKRQMGIYYRRYVQSVVGKILRMI